MPQYESGWAAARADGWCIQCMRRQAAPDKSMCTACGDARNVRSRNRNDERPTARRTRKKLQDALT